MAFGQHLQHLTTSRTGSLSRRTVIATTLIIAFLITLVPLSAYTRSHIPSVDSFHTKLRGHIGALKSSTHSAFFGARQCPAHCPSDPFVQPGMLYFGNSSRETRWVTFPVEEIQLELVDGHAKKLSEIDHMDTSGIEEYGAEALMAGLVDRKEKVIGWARDKYILIVGSSHDRNNVENFCKEVDGKYLTWGPHQGAQCHVEWLGLRVATWFFFGMADDETADWWKTGEWRPLTFEERIPQVMVPGMNATGLDPARKPDLIILSSLFWDESFISETAAHYDIPLDGIHGFSYAQVKWHRSRMQKLIHHLRDLYDDQTLPMMYRTRQIRKQARWGGMLKIFQLDQSCRAIAKKLGLRYFTWGGKLEGFQDYYDDDQHFRNGPATYLFGDMTLFYLRRAITPGCWTCHQWDD